MFRSTFKSNYNHLEGSAEHAELQSHPSHTRAEIIPGRKEKEKRNMRACNREGGGKFRMFRNHT